MGLPHAVDTLIHAKLIPVITLVNAISTMIGILIQINMSTIASAQMHGTPDTIVKRTIKLHLLKRTARQEPDQMKSSRILDLAAITSLADPRSSACSPNPALRQMTSSSI